MVLPWLRYFQPALQVEITLLQIAELFEINAGPYLENIRLFSKIQASAAKAVLFSYHSYGIAPPAALDRIVVETNSKG